MPLPASWVFNIAGVPVRSGKVPQCIGCRVDAVVAVALRQQDQVGGLRLPAGQAPAQGAMPTPAEGKHRHS
jgi:hypothetical protein